MYVGVFSLTDGMLIPGDRVSHGELCCFDESIAMMDICLDS